MLPSNRFSIKPLKSYGVGNDFRGFHNGWAHLNVFIEIGKVESYNLDRHPATATDSSVDVCVSTSIRWVGFFGVKTDEHRAWNLPLTTTHLA